MASQTPLESQITRHPNIPNPQSPGRTSAAKSKFLWIAFIVVILTAFFFRFFRLADHPLGIFFDPAISGLDSIRLMQRGGHVLFFPTNGGRESLFMYLLIPFIQLFGTTPFAIRAITAVISLLTVALLFAFLYDLRFTIYDYSPVGLQLFGPAQKTLSRLPTSSLRQFMIFFPFFAGLTLATMYWHLSVSRLGLRNVLVPMLAAPMFWFFFKGWANGQKRWFIFSGVLMGLAGYSYSAARLLPVILGPAVLPEFFIRGQGLETRNQERNSGHTQHAIRNTQYASRILRLKFLLIFTAAACIIYLPMAWYLLTHPAQFTARAGSVMVWNFLSTPAEIIAELGRNVLRVLGFFCCVGSPNPIFGLPGYPGLSPLPAPFLIIGLIIAARSWRSLFYRLIALWWLIGIAPSIIAIEAPHPLRMIVAIPPTAILVAVGLTWLQLTIINYQLAKTTAQSPAKIHPLSFILPALLILLPLPFLYHAYFVQWTTLQSTQGTYDYGAIAIRDAVLEQAENGEPIYLPLSRFNDSTLLYYLSDPFQREASFRVEPDSAAWAISPKKNRADTTWVRLQNGVATLLPPLTAKGQQLIQSALSGEAALPVKIPTTGKTAAQLAALPADPATFVEPITTPLDVSFGPVQLVGATYPQAVDAAADLPVTLFWQAKAQMSDEFEVLVRLVDDSRRAWGNGDARPTDWVYPTSFWRPGVDQIAGQHTLLLKTEPPPGRYWLAVSVFDPTKGQRLPLTGDVAGDSPDTFFVGPLKVPLPPSNTQQIAPYPATFGEVAQLEGFRVEPASPAPGDTINLHLFWQATNTPALDYTIFVHLLDAENKLMAGSDTQPVGGTYPTTLWTAGEQIRDNHPLALSPDLPPGQYQLAIGMYHQPTGQRLPITLPDGKKLSDGRLILPQTLGW